MLLTEVINQFLSDCEIRGLTEQTRVWYRKRLMLFATKLEVLTQVKDLEQVTIAHLRKFVLHLMGAKVDENNPRKPTGEKPLSAFTVRGYVRAIKVFFGWCVDEELIGTNPSSRLVQPKAPDYIIPAFTVEHIEKMLSLCDTKTDLGFRDYVLLLVLLDTGMRASELCGLRVADVHDRYVKVFGKGQKEREIGVHPEVARLIWRYIYKYRKPANSSEEGLFIGERGEPLRYGGVKALIARIKKESGIEGVRVSAHTFRHTFAKFYLRRGGELFKLCREMGHSTVQVTEMYLKDYQSNEARKEHTDYSPVGEINLPTRNKSSRRKGNK